MPIRVALLLSLLVAGLAIPAGCALADPAEAPAARVELGYEKFSLPNGLEVILHEDHRLPLVAVDLWYHVGPANETAGRTGFAHLFEHLMFQGSKHVASKAHFRYLESAGASSINGSTDFDRTNYFETVPSNQLELALWLESDRMGYLLDGLDAGNLANQRDVVRNERRQRYENAPYGLVGEEVWHQLFPAAHPYHADVIGSHADIEAASLADVREFSREYYTPNNASLAIAGDIDPRAVRALVARYFASIPAGPTVPPAAADTPVIRAQRRVVVTDQIELPRVYMAWITDPVYQPGDAEADLAAQILGGGRSSRLYRRLVHDLQIAQDVSVSNDSLRFGSVFLLTATARPGVSVADLERAIDAELATFRREGPTDAEISRARNTLETRMLRQLERLGGVADTLNRYNQYLDDPGFLPRDLARYDAVTADGIRRVMEEKLSPGARVVVEGVPGPKVVADPPRPPDSNTPSAQTAQVPVVPAAIVAGRMPDEPWRAAPPAAGPAPRFHPPTPVRLRLDNGLTVILAEDHALPIVSASVVALAGASVNPIGHPGLAAFTAAMLQEGTQRRSAAAIADDAAAAGASLGTHADRDAAAASLTVLRANLDPALDLLADVVRNPRMDPQDVERVRQLRDGRLGQLRRQAIEVSRQALLAALYGSDQPYGYPDEGTRAGNALISVADLQRFWSERYGPRTAALVLAGDLTPGQARALAMRYFGGWRSAANRTAGPGAARFVPGPQILLVDQPGAAQSTIRVGLPGPTRTTPDYVPLELMNDVYGGLFASRLNMNLREQHGYTYGANSGFRYGVTTGYFNSVTQVRSDVTVPALTELLAEQGRMPAQPPDAGELALAEGAFAQSLAGQFETSDSLSATIAELYVYGLPMNYYSTLADRARVVGAAQIQRLAARWLDPSNMKIVVVGDRARLLPLLRSLGTAPVTEVDAEGRVQTAK